MPTLVVDAGHGGSGPSGDPGATAGKLREADIVLGYALELYAAMRVRGHTVVMTRTDDTFVVLSERARIANEAKATLYVSLHCNSSENGSARGPWSIHAKGSARGKLLAHACQKSLAGVLDGKVTAVYPDGSEWVGNRTLAVLRQTKMPAVLLELGFITNAEDRKALTDEVTRRCVAEALAAAIDGELTHT